MVVIKNNENVAETINKLLKDENNTAHNKIVEDEHVKGIIITFFIYALLNAF